MYVETNLEPHGVLLNLLGALALFLVRGLDAELEGELGPCLELLGLELLDELKEGVGAEALSAALGGSAKGLAETGRVGVQGHPRVAVQDKGNIGVLDGGRGDGLGGEGRAC